MDGHRYEPFLSGSGLKIMDPNLVELQEQEANLPSGDPVRPIIVGDQAEELRLRASVLDERLSQRKLLYRAGTEQLNGEDFLPSGLPVEATIVHENGSSEKVLSEESSDKNEQKLSLFSRFKFPSFPWE